MPSWYGKWEMNSVQGPCDRMFSLGNIGILFTSVFSVPKNNALLKTCWLMNSVVSREPYYIVHLFNFNQKKIRKIFININGIFSQDGIIGTRLTLLPETTKHTQTWNNSFQDPRHQAVKWK